MKKANLILLTLTLLASFALSVCFAEATDQLAVPEFTIAYADRSYDIPETTTIDPYTGKTVQVQSRHVENRTLQFIIKNPAYTGTGQLYYVIRMKGHFSENWAYISKVAADRDSASTVLLYMASGNGTFYYHGDSFLGPSAGQADFQVQAQTWGEVMAEKTATNPFGGSITTMFGTSDWSNTQTITIPEASPSASSSANTEPISENFLPYLFITIAVAVIAFVGGILVTKFGYKKQTKSNASD